MIDFIFYIWKHFVTGSCRWESSEPFFDCR